MNYGEAMEITRITRTELNEEVFRQMKELLVNGIWKKGEKIPSEEDLSKKFGVSRITIRQALQRLTTMGLIETKSGKGRFVCVPEVGQVMEQLSPIFYLETHSLEQVNEFREMLDVWSAKLAADRATENDIIELENNFSAMSKCSEMKDWQGFALLDLEFHLKIGQITQNTLICKTYEILYEVLHNSMLLIVEKMGTIALSFHREIINAIAEHNVEKAEAIARSHVENNRNFIEGEEVPTSFASPQSSHTAHYGG